MAMGNHPQLKGEIWICQHCGQPYEPKRVNQKYCSEKCYKLHQGRANHSTRICPTCQSSFRPFAKTHIYCSSSCQREQYQIIKGFKTTRYQWENLREFILERDNYTCQDCGAFQMDIGLEAHHIKPLFRCGANTPQNLISLCHKCHKKRHTKQLFKVSLKANQALKSTRGDR